MHRLLYEVIVRRNDTARIVAAVFNDEPGSVPLIIDTDYFRTGIEREGQTYRYEPVFQQPTVLALVPSTKPRFMGWERVGLRWLKPDGNGGLTPR